MLSLEKSYTQYQFLAHILKIKCYKIFIVVYLFTLTACVPTLSHIYNGPEVTGIILRLSDLTPIENASIFYGSINTASAKNTVTKSNVQGQFVLKPTPALIFEIRMPAHMLKQAIIYTQFANYGQSADVVVSQRMNREYEKYNVGTIIVDDTPNEYAPPLLENSVDLKLLKNTFQLQYSRENCHYNDAISAVNKLNIVRKLAFKVTQLKHEADISSDKFKATSKRLHQMKKSTQNLWQYFINRCNKEKPSAELKTLKQQILRELDSLKGDK